MSFTKYNQEPRRNHRKDRGWAIKPTCGIKTDWYKIVQSETKKQYFKELETFLISEWEHNEIFPPKNDIFTAFNLTPYKDTKIVILGQDPYHDNNQAHGLAFSVNKNQKIPPSLRNIFKELNSDLNIPIPNHGNLESWAKQGILLINAVLTVRAHEANSHAKHGWETFTDAVITYLNQKNDPVIFLLWGNNAIKKSQLIDSNKHTIISSVHPSPLSAHRGFFGSKPFSKINNILIQKNKTPINWQIPDIEDTEGLPLFSEL